MIDEKDLRPFKAKDIQLGGTFYLKTGERFETCCITKEELNGPYGFMFRKMTKQYSSENRLFVRINKPWSGFNV